MPAKKRSTATEKKLKAKVKSLHKQLDKSGAKAERWKDRARRNEDAATKSRATVKKLRKRLEKASAGADLNAQTTAPAHSSPERAVASAGGPQSTTSSARSSAPDNTWTVVRLRAEARSRGLTGTSGKSKSQLLELLS